VKVISLILIALFTFLSMNIDVSSAEDKVHFDFEGSTEKWEIPDWAFYQADHKAKTVEVSDKEASSGENSIAVMCDFPGNKWAAALVEFKNENYMDFTGYKSISVDIYLPKKAPKDLIQARIILTVGDGWHFTEMRYGVPLERGKWTTIKANLDTPEDESSEWKGRGEKKLIYHQHKVQKIAVRLEYDAAPPHRIGPRYQGPIYIDNLVVE
jgi:hypothetical protein